MSEERKSSLIQFSEEDFEKILSGENNEKSDDNQQKDEKPSIDEQFQLNPSFGLYKLYIEEILQRNDYEDVIVDYIDKLLIQEENALLDTTKENIKNYKFLLGKALATCNCPSDRQNFAFLMSDRLGYRRF